jgi:hypothetical protein
VWTKCLRGKILTSFVHFSCLLPDDSGGRISNNSGGQVRSFPSRYRLNTVLHAHIPPGGWTIGTLVAAVQKRSLTPLTWSITNGRGFAMGWYTLQGVIMLPSIIIQTSYTNWSSPRSELHSWCGLSTRGWNSLGCRMIYIHTHVPLLFYQPRSVEITCRFSHIIKLPMNHILYTLQLCGCHLYSRYFTHVNIRNRILILEMDVHGTLDYSVADYSVFGLSVLDFFLIYRVFD